MEDRRSTWITHWSMQFKIVGLVIGSIFSTALLSGGFVWAIIYLMKNEVSNEVLKPAILSQLWYYGIITGAAIFVTGIIFGALSLIVSHRFVGPLNRLNRELDEMRREKNIHMVFVREDDYLSEFIENLNNVLLHAQNEEPYLSNSEDENSKN